MLCNAFPHIAGKMSSIRLPCKLLTLKIWLRLFGNHWQLCVSNGQMPHILFVRSLILSLPWLLTMVTSDCNTNLEFTGGIFISFFIWLNHLFHIGLDSSPQEEFLSLLGGARTSPPIHQFLANSLGETVCSVFLGFSHERIQKIFWLYDCIFHLLNFITWQGVKRVSKAVCGAGKELQLIVLNHLQVF